MTDVPAPARTRLTAGERSEQILRAAMEAFADGGYRGTTTDDIARRVGVSQPYVIRLFGSKQALFLASMERACDRIEAVFTAAAEQDASVDALGIAFFDALRERSLLLMLLHAYAAAGDPAIGPAVRNRFGRIYRLIRELTGTDPATVRDFLGHGALLTVMSAMEVISADGQGETDWADELLNSWGDWSSRSLA